MQPVGRLLKETFLWTSRSSTVGWVLSNQPDQFLPHLYAGTRVFGILGFPKFKSKNIEDETLRVNRVNV